jgi:hypothetical protein
MKKSTKLFAAIILLGGTLFGLSGSGSGGSGGGGGVPVAGAGPELRIFDVTAPPARGCSDPDWVDDADADHQRLRGI